MGTTNLSQTSQRSWAVPFFTIWSGQLLSQLGSRLSAFALIWWMTKTNGSATILAIGSLLGYLPAVLLGPFAGALVDKWNRRIIMIAADSIVALMVAGLAWFFWMDRVHIGQIYLLTFLSSIAGTFQGIALEASTTMMVPERHLARVQGANQVFSGALYIGGAPLGALALAVLPIHLILLLDMITAAFALAPLFYIHIPQPVSSEESTTASASSLWEDVKMGTAYIWTWTGLRTFMLIGMIGNFFGNSGFTLIPLLITKHFGGDAWQLGWMEGGFGVGLLLGGVLLTTWGGFRRRIVSTLSGLCLSVLGTLFIALAPSHAFWVAWSGMFILGIGSGFSNGAFRALMQARVKPAIQGRVFSVVGSAAQVTTMLGLLVVGPLADWVGDVQFWFMATALVLAVLVVTAFLSPALLHIEEERDENVLE